MNYIAKIYKEEDNYLVEFPDIPGCLTFGKTLDEAKAMAKDAMDAILAVKLKDGDPLPKSTIQKPNAKQGLFAIQVNENLAIAYSIFEARRGKSAAEISRKMGISRQAYQQIENPKHSLSVATLIKVAKALGKNLEINFV